MRLGIRTKQVAGVIALVALAEAVLFAWYFASLAYLLLQDTRANAHSLIQAILQGTFMAVARGGDPATAIATDEGLHTILQSAAFYEGIDYAVIVDPSGKIIADAYLPRIGTTLDEKDSLDDLTDRQGPLAQVRAIYTEGGRSFEVREPLVVNQVAVGSIRVGVSTLLLQAKLLPQLKTSLITAGVVLGASTIVAL